jgi:RecA/RadA recombinase
VQRVLAGQDVESALQGVLAAKQVKRLKNVLAKKTMALGYKLEDLIDFSEQYVKKLATGCNAIDKMLCSSGGPGVSGISTGEITEVAGATATGKTQLCLSTVAALMVDNPDVRAVYFDTCNCFSAARLGELVLSKLPESMPTDERSRLVERALERVTRVQVYDVFSLSQALADLVESEQASRHYEQGPLRLLVIDSITSIFASIIGGYGGKSTSGVPSFAAMNQVASTLQDIAFTRNLAVLITNSVVQDKSRSSFSSLKPALGRSWSKEASVRIQLQPVSSGQHTSSATDVIQATLTKSCRSCTSTATPVYFSVAQKGLIQVENK